MNIKKKAEDRLANAPGSDSGPVKQDAKQSIIAGTGIKKQKLLRVGTVGPFQYFGDKQVCANTVYPVTLLSDPVAEIYVMSKHDILRRLPKKLFSALFAPQDEDPFPTDA